MIEWFLIIVINFSIGISEKLEVHGMKPYLSHDDCDKAGRETAEWLTQDYTNVSWRCVELPKPI